jgi:hypothetical protein
MTKKTTRRTARDAAPPEEPKSVTSAASTEKNGNEAKPRVKKIAPKAEPPAAPKQRAMRVELLEGASYTVRGVTFLKDRPVVVTDERILSELEVNSRFKVESA